jgi:hypothetical protein
MSEPRPDFAGTTADDEFEVNNDQTASDSTLHGEPPLADDEAPDVDRDRTGSDTALDEEPSGLDADQDTFDAVPVGSQSLADSNSAASDTEPDPATAAVAATDGGLDAEEHASGRAPLTLGKPVVPGPNAAADPSGVDDPVAAFEPDAGSNARWREIQATFVDDPRGSVERALQAVDDEVAAVIDTLRRRQEQLAPVGQANANGQTSVLQDADQPDALAASSNPGDTERLRIVLRDCRAFWTDLAELGDRLG